MSSKDSQEMMDKCPIDGNFFVPKAGKKVCSPKCKKLWDSQQRRQRRLAEKLEAERAEAHAEADREAANARRRRQRAEKRAQEKAAANQLPEAMVQPSFGRAQVIAIVVFVVIVALLIWGLPNGR